MITTNQHSASLREALYELSVAKSVPDAELLDDFVRRYPQYATDLTEFAVELVLAGLREANEEPCEAPSTVTSPIVARAMRRFNNRLYAVKKSTVAQTTEPALTVENPFASLNRAGVRSLANQLNVNPVLIMKFRDRHIVAETVPETFQRRLADELKVPIGVLNAHLSASSQIAQGMNFKADEKPEAGAKQTFQEAVRSSGLTSEQQDALLGN